MASYPRPTIFLNTFPARDLGHRHVSTLKNNLRAGSRAGGKVLAWNAHGFCLFGEGLHISNTTKMTEARHEGTHVQAQDLEVEARVPDKSGLLVLVF